MATRWEQRGIKSCLLLIARGHLDVCGTDMAVGCLITSFSSVPLTELHNISAELSIKYSLVALTTEGPTCSAMEEASHRTSLFLREIFPISHFTSFLSYTNQRCKDWGRKMSWGSQEIFPPLNFSSPTVFPLTFTSCILASLRFTSLLFSPFESLG